MYTLFFFFNDTATTEIYTLSLHDALPIYRRRHDLTRQRPPRHRPLARHRRDLPRQVALQLGHEPPPRTMRSEEHTSELQSRQYLVCRLLLEKKKKNSTNTLQVTSMLCIPS